MHQFSLPEEVWVHVFLFLPISDQLSVRSSCKFFMRLIDRPLFWKNATLCIEKIHTFTCHSWRTLRKRKIASVVVVKAREKEWKQLVLRLPWIQSVTVDVCTVGVINSLTQFKQLTRLVLRRCVCPSLTSLSALRQLSHLSVCDVVCAPTADIINALSQLTNLTSLHYHVGSKPIPTAAFHHLLQSLAKLTHLSLKMGSNQVSDSNQAMFFPPINHKPVALILEDRQRSLPALISLELLNYTDPILSPVALRCLPSLKVLTVQYTDLSLMPQPCHLKTWLSEIPIQELNISLGYQLGVYARSVPPTVQRLSLKGVMADLKALRELAQQVPDLLHLHMDLCSYKRQSFIAEVPCLFPKLQSLAIRHYNLNVDEFFGLAQLSHLKHLVILDPNTGQNSALTDLSQKMHIQTNYRVNVITLSGSKEQMSCLCAKQ
ncbi:hypothetical protein Baya_13527 [Bagarius yarrelli]|uniref:F-box domain-containing protein n=1 Tax=Bagarius yarrelli TaxID=175774 RepID=A0A556V5Z6_BAGYA|nr:hypothetical protein Baya_13527 [Bagarius yarrelli]